MSEPNAESVVRQMGVQRMTASHTTAAHLINPESSVSGNHICAGVESQCGFFVLPEKKRKYGAPLRFGNCRIPHRRRLNNDRFASPSLTFIE